LECSGSSFNLENIRSGQNTPNPALAGWIKLRTNLDIRECSASEFFSQLEARGISTSKLPVVMAPLEELERQSYSALSEVDSLRRTPIVRAMVEGFATELRLTIRRVAVAVHEWASGVYAAHRFRHLTGRIFDRLKTTSDAALARLCPTAIEKLNHGIERA